MDYFLAIAAGAIQGLTEFLPVSSSAHLLAFHEIFNFDFPSNLSFDTALHLGTFLALVIFFYRDIWDLAEGFLQSLAKPRIKDDFRQRLPWMIILGSIPAALVGFFFDDMIEAHFHDGPQALIITSAMLIIVAVIFLWVERYAKKEKNMESLGFKGSFFCGLAQAIALIPGTSRSGITIIASLSLGLQREQAARFSFLLSLPVVAGASAKQILELISGGVFDWPLLLLGIFSAFVFGYLAIGWLLSYLNKHSLRIFAYYRMALALILLCWLYLN